MAPTGRIANASNVCTARPDVIINASFSQCISLVDRGSAAADFLTVLSIGASGTYAHADIESLVANAVAYSEATTLIVLHYSNCDHIAVRSLSDRICAYKRVLLNPTCVNVQKSCGSHLRSHLLNYMHARAELHKAARARTRHGSGSSSGAAHGGVVSHVEPQYFVMQSSNMLWLMPRWERTLGTGTRALWTGSSTRETCLRTYSAPEVTDDASQTAVHTAILRGLTGGLTGFVKDFHEGAFFPFAMVGAFIAAIEKALAPAPLATLDSLRGFTDEVYLPTFAVGQAARTRVQNGGPPLGFCAPQQKPVHFTGAMLADRVSLQHSRNPHDDPECQLLQHSAFHRLSYWRRTDRYAFKCHELRGPVDSREWVLVAVFLVQASLAWWWYWSYWRNSRPRR